MAAPTTSTPPSKKGHPGDSTASTRAIGELRLLAVLNVRLGWCGVGVITHIYRPRGQSKATIIVGLTAYEGSRYNPRFGCGVEQPGSSSGS